jgi:hypothetical protein
MLHLPQIMEKHQIILHPLRQNWSSFNMYEFTTLFNQLLITL